MPFLSSIFWVAGLALSVALAPQLRIWTWGPGMACFAISGLFALPTFWKELSTAGTRSFLLLPCFFLAIWIGVRAYLSPVEELAQSDLLLTAMAVSTFLSFHASARRVGSQRIILYGIALILLASLIVIAKQVADPVFSPIFPNEEARHPAGFFAHYSYGATFLIPASLFVAAAAFHSREHWVPRILLGLVAVGAVYSVYLTNSRGGVVGMAGGLALFILLSILSGSQRKKKWFAPAIIIFPFIAIAIGVFFIKGLLQIQEGRGGSGGAGALLDNDIRFYLAGIATSCIALHPLIGGGSRSFSWECFQFWDTDAMGLGFAKPEHVHNELLQTASDYGLIGGGLAVLVLIVAGIVAVTRIVSTNERSPDLYRSFWRIGGLAGLAGVVLQSGFEGIFRIPPGAVVLALCLSACFLPIAISSQRPTAKGIFSSTAICLACAAFVGLLAFFGWKGTIVSNKIWATYFSEILLDLESQADQLTDAIPVWPLATLYEKRARTYQQLAVIHAQDENAGELKELAFEDFKTASRLHPFNPEMAINAANIAGALGKDAEANEFFQKGIALQGEMEAAFFGHKYYYKFLNRKGIREFEQENYVEALTSFKLAIRHIEKITALYWPHFGGAEETKSRISVYENLAKCLAKLGENQQAMEVYDNTAKLPYGATSHYHASELLGELAVKAWKERRGADALKLFTDAKLRLAKSQELPPGVTPQKKAEWLAYLEKSIKYLTDAKFEPSEKVEF